MENVIGCLAAIGAFVVICWLAVLVIALWPESKPRPKRDDICACLEYMGDNPDCPQHANLARYLRSDPVERARFQKEQEQRRQPWGTDPQSCDDTNTVQVHEYMRRRSKVN